MTMSPRTMEIAAAVVLALLVLVFAPGVAVVGIIGLVVLAGCGGSVALGRRRRRLPAGVRRRSAEPVRRSRRR